MHAHSRATATRLGPRVLVPASANLLGTVTSSTPPRTAATTAKASASGGRAYVFSKAPKCRSLAWYTGAEVSFPGVVHRRREGGARGGVFASVLVVRGGGVFGFGFGFCFGFGVGVGVGVLGVVPAAKHPQGPGVVVDVDAEILVSEPGHVRAQHVRAVRLHHVDGGLEQQVALPVDEAVVRRGTVEGGAVRFIGTAAEPRQRAVAERREGRGRSRRRAARRRREEQLALDILEGVDDRRERVALRGVVRAYVVVVVVVSCGRFLGRGAGGGSVSKARAAKALSRARRRIAHAPSQRVDDGGPARADRGVTRRHRIVHAAGGDAAAVAVVVLKQAALVSLRVDARVHLGMRRHGEELHGGGGGGRREEERGEEEEDGAGVWRWGHDVTSEARVLLRK